MNYIFPLLALVCLFFVLYRFLRASHIYNEGFHHGYERGYKHGYECGVAGEKTSSKMDIPTTKNYHELQ